MATGGIHFPGTWSWLLSSSSGLRLARTTDPKTGPVKLLDEWLFDIREPKTPPSDRAKHLHFKHTYHENSCNSDTAQNVDYLGFSLLSITSLYSQDHPISLSHKYPKPLAFREVDMRGYKPFLCCESWSLEVLTCCAWGKWTWFGNNSRKIT